METVKIILHIALIIMDCSLILLSGINAFGSNYFGKNEAKLWFCICLLAVTCLLKDIIN